MSNEPFARQSQGAQPGRQAKSPQKEKRAPLFDIEIHFVPAFRVLGLPTLERVTYTNVAFKYIDINYVVPYR